MHLDLRENHIGKDGAGGFAVVLEQYPALNHLNPRISKQSDRINRGRESYRSVDAVRAARHRLISISNAMTSKVSGRETSSFVTCSNLWSSFIGDFNVLFVRQVAICLEDRQQETET